MTAQQLHASRTRLESYWDEMLTPLGRKDRRHGGQVYVRSLLPTSRDYAFIEFGHRGEPLPSAPHDGRTRRRVVFSVEIPTETSDRDQRLPYRWRGRRQFLFEAFE